MRKLEVSIGESEEQGNECYQLPLPAGSKAGWLWDRAASTRGTVKGRHLDRQQHRNRRFSFYDPKQAFQNEQKKRRKISQISWFLLPLLLPLHLLSSSKQTGRKHLLTWNSYPHLRTYSTPEFASWYPLKFFPNTLVTSSLSLPILYTSLYHLTKSLHH